MGFSRVLQRDNEKNVDLGDPLLLVHCTVKAYGYEAKKANSGAVCAWCRGMSPWVLEETSSVYLVRAWG